jgi:tetratricopeptide (TPR) repeat protein
MSDSSNNDIIVGRPRTLIKLDHSLVRRGLDDLSRALPGAADNPEDVWIEKGLDCEHNGDYKEAIACFERALEISPRSVEALLLKSTSLRKLGQLPEAISCLDRCLEIYPLCFSAWIEKAWTLETQGHLEEAIACYDSAHEAFSANVKGKANVVGWIDKGHVLARLGRYDEALGCFDKVLEVERITWPIDRTDDHVDAWNSKAATFYRMRRYHECIECCDKAIQLDSQYWHPWFNKANSFRMLKKFDEAVACFDRLLEIDPSHATIWNTKGLCLEQMGKLVEALSSYEKAFTLNPPEILGCYNKARIEEALGRSDDAKKSYEKYLTFAFFDDDQEFQYALERLLKLKPKALVLDPGTPRYAYVAREQGASIEAGAIGYSDMETAILEALKQKRSMHAAGELSEQAYRQALREYREMIGNHMLQQDETDAG